MSTCGLRAWLCTVERPLSPVTGARRGSLNGGRQHEAPVPWGRGPRTYRAPQGRAGRGAWEELAQRHRIDMIRPATMAPNPMAKFQADSDTMNGMRSPAT